MQRFGFGHEPAAPHPAPQPAQDGDGITAPLATRTEPLATRTEPLAARTAPLATRTEPLAPTWQRQRTLPVATAPLVDFLPPVRALPFREALAAPGPAPTRQRRASAWLHISFRSAAVLVLFVLDVVMLGYLVATWRR